MDHGADVLSDFMGEKCIYGSCMSMRLCRIVLKVLQVTSSQVHRSTFLCFTKHQLGDLQVRNQLDLGRWSFQVIELGIQLTKTMQRRVGAGLEVVVASPTSSSLPSLPFQKSSPWTFPCQVQRAPPSLISSRNTSLDLLGIHGCSSGYPPPLLGLVPRERKQKLERVCVSESEWRGSCWLDFMKARHLDWQVGPGEFRT